MQGRNSSLQGFAMLSHNLTVQDFAKHIKNSKVHIFKNASHEHHLESENEYLEIVEKFLSENDKLFI